MTMSWLGCLAAFISGIIGGAVTLLVNYWLGTRKQYYLRGDQLTAAAKHLFSVDRKPKESDQALRKRCNDKLAIRPWSN